MRTSGNYIKYPFISVKFSKSFFPFFTELWNSLPRSEKGINNIDDFKNKMKEKFKPKKIKFYSKGCKLGNRLITHLRVGRSFLNAHGFSIGLSPSPNCDCGASSENSIHFLLDCPIYNSERQTMLGLVEQQISSFPNKNRVTKENILLFGFESENPDYFNININITIAVQNFLMKTKRFTTLSHSSLFIIMSVFNGASC